MLLVFTLAGNFRWNITLSAVARLFTYGSIAIAMLLLRKRQPGAEAFRVPMGSVIAGAAIAFCVVLLVRMPLSNVPVVAVTAGLAAANWAASLGAENRQRALGAGTRSVSKRGSESTRTEAKS